MLQDSASRANHPVSHVEMELLARNANQVLPLSLDFHRVLVWPVYLPVLLVLARLSTA